MNSIFSKLSFVIISMALCAHAMASSVSSEVSQAEKMVVDFYEQIFIKKANIREVSERYVHPDYIQHNPYVGTGREAFIEGMGEFLKSLPATSKLVIKRVITSGDYVVLHAHAFDTAKKEPGLAGVDIFRVESGKIIEHWDVWQDIPENMPHKNGML